MSRRPVFAALLVLAACKRTAPPEASAVEAGAAAASVATPAGAAPVATAPFDGAAICARVQRETEAKLTSARRVATAKAKAAGRLRPLAERRSEFERAKRSALAPPRPDDDETDLLFHRGARWAIEHSPETEDLSFALPWSLQLVGTCHVMEKGAWAIELERFARGDEDWDGWHGTWALVHYDGRGRTAIRPGTGESAQGDDNVAASYGDLHADIAFYDFDHDGDAEVFLRFDEVGDEGHLLERSTLVTHRDRAIVPYAPAAAVPVRGLRDVDGDGTPDLLTHFGYTYDTESCGSGFALHGKAPRFAAIASRDGTFHTDVEPARAFVRAWCPKPPAKIQSPNDALCARMWSTPATVAPLRAAAARCVRRACNDANPNGPVSSDDCTARLAWFDREPPVVLGAP